MAKLPKGVTKAALEEAKQLLGRFATTKSIANRTKKGGGYSVNLLTGETPSSGLMMGKYANTDARNMVLPRAIKTSDVAQHVAVNRKALQKPESFLGTWVDPDTGKTYLDVSQRFDPSMIRAATKMGEKTGQLAGYNIGAGESFPVGRLEDFVRGPVFEKRQKELAEQGYDYMRRMGQSPSWWPLQNSALEEVYGEKMLPYVSGYTASTAPNTPPRVNMQQATEYLRRHTLGEPAAQPDWRSPEGLLSMGPGRQMPLEQSRRLNLARTQRGALEELSREKVNREGAALMGDPNAVVVDRWHIRTAEDPSLGVYVAPKEGVIGGSKNYNLIENAIADIGRGASSTPAEFSSMSWTGGRERARTTGELFGVPYRKGSIPAESYGYPSHFEDLVKAKAGQLGVSESKIKQLLREGRISLLKRGGLAVKKKMR